LYDNASIGAGVGFFGSESGGKKTNRRSGPEKIEADLSWDALAKKYLEMFEGARRSSEWRVAGKWWLE
jgi:hypothetical protein